MWLISWFKHLLGIQDSTPAAQPVTPQPAPIAVVSPPAAPAAPKVYPLKGWSQDFQDFIIANVSPEMLQFPCPSFCPKWSSLTDAQKRKMWACILESTSYAESGFNRVDLYMETGIPGTDPVTGLTIISEGFLQISYGDSQLKGLFDWVKDKPLFEADIANRKGRAEWNALVPRTIHDPLLNLMGGIRIWTQLIQVNGNEPAMTSIGGHYWSTMRPGRNEDTLSHFRNIFPEGF